MAEERRREHRKRRARSAQEYERTIRPKIALNYAEIIKFGTSYAASRLRRPLSKHQPRLSDLLPGQENARDIATEAFTKLLSGERQDWNGELETLHQAVGSCINSILSSRLKRSDNLLTLPIEDIKLDWQYSNEKQEDAYLEPVEEVANRHSKARIIRSLLPARAYRVEAEILSIMVIHRVFNLDVLADLTGIDRKQISQAFVRLAKYVQTDQFAKRLSKAFGESVSSVALVRQIAQKTGRVSERAAAAAVPLFASGLAFGLSTGQLAESIGLKSETLRAPVRVHTSGPRAPAEEMGEIITRISDWAGGNDQAATWYRAQPIAAFGGRTPESLVKSGQASALRDYLDHIAMGGFA